MKQFGGVGSALLLIAAFLVASSLADDEVQESATSNDIKTGEPVIINVTEVLPLVHAVLTELAIKLPDEHLALKHANSATKQLTRSTIYVILGTFSSASHSDLTCEMRIVVDDIDGILNNKIDCAIKQQYKIHISIKDDASVKNRAADVFKAR